MTLTLRAVSLNDHPLTQPITVHFDAQGGSIGRADHNTMALPDPKRHISRRQAEVLCDDDGFSITNVGSANPIVVGTRTLARGESSALAQGDSLRIGGYLLEVEVAEGASAAAASITRGRAAVDAATPPPSSRDPAASDAAQPPVLASFAGDGEVALSPGNPFASLFAAPAPAVDAPALPARRLPDDFDPFAPPPAAAPAVATSAPSPAPAGAFGDLLPSTEPASLDKLFGLNPRDGRDALAAFLAADASPPASARNEGAPAAAPLSTDPMALFGFQEAPAGAGALPTGSDHVPEWQAAFAPPRLAHEPAADARRPEAHRETGEAAGVDDAAAGWAAFCEGAGVAVERPAGGDAQTMRLLGAVLRASVDGTLRLMAVRASAKHELRAPVTVIQPQRNNPLKFSPDVNGALEQLLQPALRGFLPGPEAVQDAMDDLVGHAVGTLAGTRAALEGVLDRFAPQQLESKLHGRSSVLDSVLPMNRKARLWELYLQHFEAIRAEAQDDFHSLFGRAFLAAYEQQLERLRSETPGGSSAASPA